MESRTSFPPRNEPTADYDPKDLTDLLVRVRAALPEIHGSYQKSMRDDYANKLINLEQYLLDLSENPNHLRATAQRLLIVQHPTQCIVNPMNESQLGIITSHDSLRNFKHDEDGSLFTFERELATQPFAYRPAGTKKKSLVPVDNKPNDPSYLRDDLHIYTQFVFYAIQDTPIITAISILNEVIKKEEDSRPTLPPPSKDVPPRVSMLPLSPIHEARDNLLNLYEIGTVALEELLLERLGFDTDNYAPERLKNGSSINFYKGLTLGGLINLMTNWYQICDVRRFETPTRNIIESFKKINIRKEARLV
ncbi:hypothetical protein ACFL96_07935 [Thermoproteota archaeon]